MTVLIACGWIASLRLGLSLHQVGSPFRIFEAVCDSRLLGVGINLQPHATRELIALGLEPAFDKILHIVVKLAPAGFADIEAVVPQTERQAFADGYKAIAGMDIAALNASPPIMAGA